VTEPVWLTIARKYVGLREVPGKTTAPVIARWLRRLGAWWRDDETPWCGVFVAGVLDEAGIPRVKNWFRARAWLDWGSSCGGPMVGAIVVFQRAGGGHVGFLVGRDERGRLMILGGNQANAVTIAPFDPERVLGYRWPWSVEPDGRLPLVASNGAPVSRNEA
jgi:uncharacterized protein (TIGR02594 family)